MALYKLLNTNAYNVGCMCTADVRGESGQFCECEEYSGRNGYLLPSSGHFLNLINVTLACYTFLYLYCSTYFRMVNYQFMILFVFIVMMLIPILFGILFFFYRMISWTVLVILNSLARYNSSLSLFLSLNVI